MCWQCFIKVLITYYCEYRASHYAKYHSIVSKGNNLVTFGIWNNYMKYNCIHLRGFVVANAVITQLNCSTTLSDVTLKNVDICLLTYI